MRVDVGQLRQRREKNLQAEAAELGGIQRIFLVRMLGGLFNWGGGYYDPAYAQSCLSVSSLLLSSKQKDIGNGANVFHASFATSILIAYIIFLPNSPV